MTYDEYWNQDPWLVADYRKAWKLQEKNRNYLAWLQGLYNYKAVSTALSNAFRKKGAKPLNYFEKPIGGEEEQSVLEIRQSVYDRLEKFKEQWDVHSK